MQVFLIVLLLLSLNGLFVAAEFAAVAVRRNRVAAAAKQGKTSAKILLPILENPERLDRYISACQLGITTTSIALGAYGQQELAYSLGQQLDGLGGMRDVAAQSLSVIIVLTILTILQMVLGEQVPKSFALQRANLVALTTVRLIVWTQRLISPVLFVLNGCSRLILKMMRAPVLVYSHVHSRQEIDLLLEQSREGGVFGSEKHQQLQHALELEEITARQLMVPRPKISALDYEAESDVVLEQIVDGPHTRIPVYKDGIDNIVGILHTKEIAKRATETGHIGNWHPLMRPVLYVSEGMTGDRLITRMRESQAQQAIVMDEFGGVAGLVTLEDVLRHVFGAMGDEFSQEEASPERLPDGRFRLAGSLRLDDVEDVIGIAFESAATTIGGHVIETLGRIPVAGERAELEGASVEVERVTANVIESVLVSVQRVGQEGSA